MMLRGRGTSDPDHESSALCIGVMKGGRRTRIFNVRLWWRGGLLRSRSRQKEMVKE